jgi:Ca-activated chloride channel family protein
MSTPSAVPIPRSGRFRRAATALALAALALVLVPGLARAERFRPAELLVEAVGATPEALSADSLEVVAEGEVLPVTGVEPLGEPWRIVIYFDQLLTEPPVYRSALLDLEELARPLTALGTVEIVLSGEQITVTLPPTEDPLVLEQALRWLQIRETTDGGQIALRSDFIQEHLINEELEEAGSALEAERLTEIGAAMRAAVEDEAEMLRRQRINLLSWLADQDTAGPKALLMVTSGFDSSPAEFYGALVAETRWRQAGIGLPQPEVLPAMDEIAQALAVYGWTTLAYAPPNQGDGLLADAPLADPEEDDDTVEMTQQGGVSTPKTTATIDPRKLLSRIRKQSQLEELYSAQLLSPYEPLQVMAAATGGEVVVDRLQLGDSVRRLGDRRVVRFEPGSGSQSPRPVELRWSPEGTTELRARRYTGSTTPEVISALRAEQYLTEGIGEGELFISAAVAAEQEEAGLVLEIDPEGLRTEGSQPLRVTVAMGGDDSAPTVLHQVVDLADAEESSNETARFVMPVELPEVGEPVVVVFVEELASGRWGGTFASFSVATTDLGANTVQSLLLPAPKAIHLMAPQEAMVMGRTTLDTVVSQGRVAKVQFYLDGDPVATVAAPPFSTTVDLGKLPEMHRVEVVAFDVTGQELGRDRLTLNAGMGSFRVRILKPEETPVREGELVTGAIEVEAEVETPRGADIDRVEFYWKEQLASTRYAPPYVQRVTVPADDPSGFVRVVGYLEDGTVSEDVVFINSQGSTERLQVDLVELYVVVTDRKGRPVRGLGRDSFQVLEEGVQQELADFGDASDQPLTVGLAIDSSASMFIKLPDVQDAAASFVRQLRTKRDRAFVVGFGNEPRLARDTTSDLTGVVDGLYRLKPDGQTAIWKAVVYSLVQLQGAGGKKALIVFSDGADEDPDFSYRTALDFARRVGAPIYFIVSNDEIYRTAGKSLTVRGFLGRLNKITAEVGGRVFLTKVTEDLEEIYSDIEEELRSQYVVSYYAKDFGGNKWRKVTVEVDRPGAEARTLSGYFR